MSFMINPHPYDDITKVNYLDTNVIDISGIIKDKENIITELNKQFKNKSFIFDYYLDDTTLGMVSQNNFPSHTLKNVADFYIEPAEFINKIKDFLPTDLEEDPFLLFGKIYEGEIEDFLDKAKLEAYFEVNANETILLYGIGAASRYFTKYIDSIVYYDRTPKDLSLIVSKENYNHLIARYGESFNEKLRQFYYIDMMVAMRLRKELIQNDLISYYILENPKKEVVMLQWDNMADIFKELTKKPIRPKPIYLPGVWGGEMIKTIRNLHEHIEQKIAWVFEFIPLESSVGIIIGDYYLDVPFYSLLNHQETEILGKHVVKQYDGFFPVRVNYDDTWHGDGNMSIQVHPSDPYIKEKYNEYGSQDEAYYIVATGHNALTYAGLNIPKDQFVDYCADSHKNKTTINYREFVNSFESKPGMQFMIPGGTLHASGRNQLVLEHGSLTVGSYTYKIYDYVRKDLNGKPRPIHIHKGRKALVDGRDGLWAKENMIMEPLLLTSTNEYNESIIGRNETIYYETRRIEIDVKSSYTSHTNGEFVLLVLVDGQKVKVSSMKDKAHSYEAKYLDVLIVPAQMEEYKIEALGYQPVIVHKTLLK